MGTDTVEKARNILQEGTRRTAHAVLKEDSGGLQVSFDDCTTWNKYPEADVLDVTHKRTLMRDGVK